MLAAADDAAHGERAGAVDGPGLRRAQGHGGGDRLGGRAGRVADAGRGGMVSVFVPLIVTAVLVAVKLRLFTVKSPSSRREVRAAAGGEVHVADAAGHRDADGPVPADVRRPIAVFDQAVPACPSNRRWPGCRGR